MTWRRRQLLMTAVAAAFAAVAAFSFGEAEPAQAVISGSPCSGNVCTGSLVVGGQTVQYSYTQHLTTGGQFRIRLNGGTYGTASLVSFIVHDVPVFTSTGYLANPTNGAQAMTEVDVNPGNTAYERRDSDGCASCIYDHVMSLNYGSLAPGTYAFSFTIVQNGDSGGRNDLPFYVDATAPSNGNESNTWTAVGAPTGMDFPCADTIDNDLDFYGDCADVQCNGSVGQVATGARCQIPESTCNDEFDNDADGLPDCLDANCDGLVGQPLGTALCQYQNERGAGCTDGFNNDADTDPADGQPLTDCVDNRSVPPSTPALYCWKQAASGCPAVENCATGVDDDKDKSYDDAWDKNAGTGINCQDYDCAGNPACPAQENKTAGGADADAQCFNGIDDDLDHAVDCADSDCSGIVNPGNTNQVCYEKEFDLGQSYQFCGNSFDDDGDGPQDCADSDCRQRFGNCGPCPGREDFTFDSCSNDGTAQPRDDDTDGASSCADIDCAGKLGTLGAAAMCAAAEDSNELCADGFDNDRDTAVDCADAGCNGRIGPLGATCQTTEAACGDGKDNDGDGAIDCVDANCAGVGSCAAASWTQAASCVVVPSYSGPTSFTSNDPTVTAVVRLKTWVSTTDTVRFLGTGTYSSVTIILGDNTDATKYYPYAAAGCTITGTNASRFSFTQSAGRFVNIFQTAGPDVAGFDITLTCTTPAAPAAVKNYPISISVQKNPGAVAEVGDANFSTTLYEHTVPTMTEIEPEGDMGGTFKVPYGGLIPPPPVPTRKFRGVPNDPGAGLNSSGICRCQLELDGTVYDTGPNCLSAGIAFTADKANFQVRGRAEDGAGNLGAYNAAVPFALNVTPIVKTPLTLSPSKPFVKTGAMDITVDTEFQTGSSDFFNASCELYVRNAAGTIVINGPVGPSATFPALPPFVTATRCQATLTLGAIATDGTYFVTVKEADNDGDPIETNRKALFKCDTVPAPGDPEPTNGCQWADFDFDGASEGLYTTLYSTAPKACDNCVNLANDQTDANANGVGDICEPNDQYGRCEIDTEIVCSYSSDNALYCPGDALCCPGPSIGIDYSNDLSPVVPAFQPKDPQACKFAWGICTLGGQVCFEDVECPGEPPNNGIGRCQDNLTTCKRDVDCSAIAGTPKCGGRCQDDTTWCVSDTDCGVVAGTPKCAVADVCENLLFPWLQTVFGNVFSKKKITGADNPPQNQYNATFCITAKDTIVKFASEGLGGCAAVTDATVRYELPQTSNTFSTVLGKLDVAGLRAGKYGTVVSVPAGQLESTLSGYPSLGGRVFRVTADDAVSAHVILNDAARGAGTIFVDGANVTINGDITYSNASVTSLDQLASLGWIVVPTAGGVGGNVYVKGTVTTISGSFYIGGADGFYSVAPPESDSPAPLTVYGMVISRQFHLSRSFKSLTQGSERFIYDGRAVVNPPPGFGDLTRALPLFVDTPVP